VEDRPGDEHAREADQPPLVGGQGEREQPDAEADRDHRLQGVLTDPSPVPRGSIRARPGANSRLARSGQKA
jgi:hypothetical protein